jgi:5-methyltetrahydrofolate--homocysteine methyltransferase
MWCVFLRYFASLSDRSYLTLEQARARRFVIDFVAQPPVKPVSLGITVSHRLRDFNPLSSYSLLYQVLDDLNIEELVPYIDWKPFFEVWYGRFSPRHHSVCYSPLYCNPRRQLRGKYPNRAYPRIFDDETVWRQAIGISFCLFGFERRSAPRRKSCSPKLKRSSPKSSRRSCLWPRFFLFYAFLSLLLAASGSCGTMQGVFGLFAANTVNIDDIEVYADDTRSAVKGTLHGLRQQAEKLDATDPYMCLSDFVAPKTSGTSLR